MPFESEAARDGEEFGAAGCRRIVAFGITAPEGSCTVPEMSEEDCAAVDAAMRLHTSKRMESFGSDTNRTLARRS